MNKNEVKIKVTFEQVLDAPLIGAWEEMCNKYGINEWCLNEGLVNNDDVIEVSLEEAERWGIIKNE